MLLPDQIKSVLRSEDQDLDACRGLKERLNLLENRCDEFGEYIDIDQCQESLSWSFPIYDSTSSIFAFSHIAQLQLLAAAHAEREEKAHMKVRKRKRKKQTYC